MAIHFSCEACSRPLSAPDDKQGKLAICPECGARLRVPGGQAPPRPQVVFESIPDPDDAPSPGRLSSGNQPPNVFQPANLGESAVVRSTWTDPHDTPAPMPPPDAPRRRTRRRSSSPPPAPPPDDSFLTGQGFLCPYCGSRNLPEHSSRVSTAGWVVFSALLVTCFPLCFLGLFIREEQHNCTDCGIRIGGD